MNAGLSEERMNGDATRDAAHALTAIADYAEKMPYPQASKS